MKTSHLTQQAKLSANAFPINHDCNLRSMQEYSDPYGSSNVRDNTLHFQDLSVLSSQKVFEELAVMKADHKCHVTIVLKHVDNTINTTALQTDQKRIFKSALLDQVVTHGISDIHYCYHHQYHPLDIAQEISKWCPTFNHVDSIFFKFDIIYAHSKQNQAFVLNMRSPPLHFEKIMDNIFSLLSSTFIDKYIFEFQKFVSCLMLHAKIRIAPSIARVFDPQLLAYIVDSDDHLKTNGFVGSKLFECYLNVKQNAMFKSQSEIAQIEMEHTYELWNMLAKTHAWAVACYDMEMQICLILSEMQLTGIAFDREFFLSVR
jgi:hypothetical protein